jgi:CrtC N-terminal lipocalin domain
MTAYNGKPACRLAATPEDFEHLNLTGASIALWEDGLRTDTKPGSYEWWYFDSHLDDGSSLVVAFYTKNPMEPGHPLEPFVTVALDRPGAKAVTIEQHFPAGQFTASKDRCDVRVAANAFSGDLRSYEIQVEHDDIAIDARLSSQVPPWRPATGHLYFGAHNEHFFAWLPSVPQGTVAVNLTVGGRTERLSGIGYHDHNWGDTPMPKLINHWYWGRAQAGPYSIIASHITAERSYGNAEVPTFMLAKGGSVVADDASKVRFHVEDEHLDEHSGKPVGDVVGYEYDDGHDRYLVSFHRKQTIVNRQLIGEVSGYKHLLARLARFDGSYLRFTGTVQLEHFTDSQKIEDFSDPGIWELMYFGHTR